MSLILVVDDDVKLCQLLNKVLNKENYDVHCVHDGESALDYLQTNSVDLVLLDVMLPNIDGLSVAKRICQDLSTPILMLTALTDENTMLEGLQAGADHYLSKPFRVPELLTRINVIIRRVTLERQRYASNNVFSKHFSRLSLTETEQELVTYLINVKETIVSKATLQKEVLRKELCIYDRNLDVHISNIRRKFVLAGLSKKHIKTVRGQGYLFSEEVI